MRAVSSSTGLALVLDHVAELAAVLALLLLCLAVGLAVQERARLGETERPLGFLLSGLLLGLGACATAILFLGLAGLIRPWSLGLAAAAIAVVVRRRFGESLALLERSANLVRSRWDLAAFAVLGVVAAALLTQASAPVTDWDSLIYHLEVPRAWLAEGRIHLPADNLHAAFAGLVHLLYVPLLALGAPSGAATLNSILGCVLAVALFEFGDRFFDRSTGRIAMVTLFGSPVVLFVAMTPRVDATLTLFLLTGLYSMYRAALGAGADGEGNVSGGEHRDVDRKGLHAAAALLGLATSVKLLAVPWVVASAPVALWALTRVSTSGRDAIRLGGGALAVFLLAAAPGAILRWHLTGAPLYPYLSPRLLEPWLQPWFGTTVVPPEAVLEPRAPFTREPVTLWALLTSPGALTPEREGGLYFLSPILWLTPLAVLRIRRARITWLLVVAAIFVAVVLGRGGRTNLRYLLPAVVLLTLVGSHLLAWAHERLGRDPVRRAMVGAVLVLAIAPAILPFAFRWSEMPTFGHLAGTVSEAEYLTENDDPDVYLWARTARWLDRRLSPDDRLLLLFEGRGFHLETPKIQDNLMANWPLLARRRASGDCLARAGVTHVLVNYGVLDVHMSHGMPASAVAWSAFPRFARECLAREAVRSPYALYRVVGGRSGRNRGSADTGEGEEP